VPDNNGFSLLNEALGVSRETFSDLTIYYDLLVKWQERVNLISPDTTHDIWRRHFLDSLQILPHLPETQLPIIDIGSGAGFPGLAICVVLKKEVHLVESDMKKSIFLREVARLTRSPAIVHNCRAESQTIEEAGIILSRACSSLTDLLYIVENFVSRETICLFHKGKNYGMEIEEAKKKWQFDCQIFPSLTESQSAIVKLSKIAKQEMS
jgi:16S rRNA (guanine527-N7)-methyltransferase